MKTSSKFVAALSFLFVSMSAQSAIIVQMNMIDENGIGKSIGTVSIDSTQYGLVFSPTLTDLPGGLHGFHVHELPNCAPKEKDGKMVVGLSAGGHYDPAGSKRHGMPWGDGHKGDLPSLFVDGTGNAKNPVLAPRLQLEDVRGRSLMIHVGGDNHADHPMPLGGGGARMACGVIQ
jgi:Cu-Zn family superoxide dismutase